MLLVFVFSVNILFADETQSLSENDSVKMESNADEKSETKTEQKPEPKTVQSVTTITIVNSRQTNYRKDESTGNDTIVLEGNVVLTVQKDSSTSEISAEKITYDRKTEMLYAEGDVSIVTKDSSSGNDTATAETLLLNTSTLEAVFDGGRIVQTQSDALSLPSGSTLIVFSNIFGRSESNVIAFKNSSLTFCDDINPHWHIDATRTWLLPGGEFAFFNALLYVGVIPVLYLPAFYYPKDELIFNPVFGSKPRAGSFVQNTFYLKGRKTSSDTSTNSSSSSDATADTMKALYNFMKPSVLKEQRREGLMMHNLDQDYKGSTSEYVKIMADWYENIGAMTGISGNLTPSKDYITSLNFDARLGFSNTVYKSNEKYSFLNKDGLRTMDDSQFLGIHAPFRYAGTFSMTLSKPFRLTLSLPVYSDPYFSNDFNLRSESMDWISYLMSLANPPDDSSAETVNTVSSYAWQMTASFSPTMPSFMKPYVSSLSMSLNSSVNIASMYTEKKLLQEMAQDKGFASDWEEYTPRRSFYYPSQVTPLSAKASVSGTIFEYPKSVSSTKSSGKSQSFVTFNKPDEFKSQKELDEDEKKRLETQAEKSAAENQENPDENGEKNGETKKNDAGEKQDYEEADQTEEKFEYVPTLPALSGTVPSITSSSSFFKYKFGYSLSPDIVYQISYKSEELKSSEDFKWKNYSSDMYTIKSPVSLNSSLNLANDFISLSDKVSYNPVWQNHPHIFEEYNDESTIKRLRKADYIASSQNITGSQTFTLKPFSSIPLLKDSKVSHNINMKLFRYEFVGDDTDENWDENWKKAFEKYTFDKIDWEYENDDSKYHPESFFTAHSVDLSLASSQFNNKIKETFTISSILWPLTEKYNGSFSLSVPNASFSLSTSFTPEKTYESENKKDVEKKWDPVQQSFSYSVNIFDSPLKFTQSLVWNNDLDSANKGKENYVEKKGLTSFRLSASWKFISASFASSYTYGADLERNDDGTPKQWNNRSEKEFIPTSFSAGINPSTKSFFNDTVKFGLNSSVTMDLIKPTSNYLTFAPSITLKAGDLNISFSSTSRNSVLYWYFNRGAGYDHYGTDVFSGLKNMIWDLDRSFHFQKESDRKASGYKLKTLSMTMTQDLHDWKFSFSMSISPRLKDREYRFDPYITVGIVWNPMSSIKTEIVDEYGKWQLNKSK